jgi:adenine/guanine phosphoribosyltransferase-like PRPP-binding protein
VLVDDVVTTGATVSAATHALEATPTVVLAATLVPAGRSGRGSEKIAATKTGSRSIAEPLTARTDK